jgi:4-hydroxy-2-oxoheptanedioate aldolase
VCCGLEQPFTTHTHKDTHKDTRKTMTNTAPTSADATVTRMPPAPPPGMPLDTRLRSALTSPTTLLNGLFCGLPHPALVEMAAFAGFDFVVIDNEHGMASFETTEHLLRAARASGIVPIVRCFEADIPRVLDAGASGIKVPMVQTPEQAQRIVQRIRYPRPEGQAGQRGTRGSAFSTRAAGYGRFGGPPHTDRSNEHIGLIVMLETPQALEAAADIAQVEGVDAVFIGPNDLAHSMGHENRWRDEPVQQAMEKAIRAIASTGKCAGILALDQASRDSCRAWGARYTANVASSLIMRAFEQAAGGQTEIRY